MEFIDPRKASLLPIQHLAWIGDAVYELYSRQRLVLGGAAPGRPAHRASARQTSAQGQARAVRAIQAELTQEEAVAPQGAMPGVASKHSHTARPRGWRWWWAGCG